MQIFATLTDALDSGDARSFVLSKNGYFKAVRVGNPEKPLHGYFIGKTEQIPDNLDLITPQILLMNLVPIPALLIAKAAAIFRRVYQEHHSEMIVFLRWKETDVGNGKKLGRYYLDRAERVSASAGGLDYLQQVPIVGSIHSHGGFGASFSSIDDKWEKNDCVPGIYITLGNVDREIPSIEVSLAGMGVRKILDPPNIPKEVYGAVTISDEEYKWWTETFTSTPYSRTEGYYICLGKEVTGWVPDMKADLKIGEQLMAVNDYHKLTTVIPYPKVKNGSRTYFTIDRYRPSASEPKPAIELLNIPTKDDLGISAKHWKQLQRTVTLALRERLVSELMELLLAQCDEYDLDEIDRTFSVYLEDSERNAVIEGDDPCGKLRHSDVEALGSIWEKDWGDYWRT